MTKTTVSINTELAQQVRQELAKLMVAGERKQVNVSGLVEELLGKWVERHKERQAEVSLAIYIKGLPRSFEITVEKTATNMAQLDSLKPYEKIFTPTSFLVLGSLIEKK